MKPLFELFVGISVVTLVGCTSAPPDAGLGGTDSAVAEDGALPDASGPDASTDSGPAPDASSVDSGSEDPSGPRILEPQDGSTLDSSTIAIRLDDGDNAALKFDIHASRSPFDDTEFRIGEVFRTGTYEEREYTGVVPTDGSELYVRVYYTLPDGDWGGAEAHLRDGRYLDLQVTLHAEDDPDHGPDFDAILEEVDLVLADFDNWWFNEGTVLRTQQGYHGGAALRGIAQIYKTTNDSAYLDRGIQVSHHWIDSGAQMDGDGYLDWEGEDNGEVNINIEHHEWRAACGIADILIEVQRSGYEGGIPGTKAKFVQFLRREVWEKWTAGHGIVSAGWLRSSRGTLSSGNNGRWALIALALDQTHATPGNNEYYEFLNSTEGPNEIAAYGQFFTTMIDMESNGRRYIPGKTDDNGGPDDADDTSHAGDLTYAIMRAKQLGYDTNGYMDEWLGVYERLLDDLMFPTSQGFQEWTDGSGGTNTSNWSSSHGHALSAALSTDLKDRWVEFVRDNDPYFYGNDVSPDRTLWMAGGVLWALAGNTL